MSNVVSQISYGLVDICGMRGELCWSCYGGRSSAALVQPRPYEDETNIVETNFNCETSTTTQVTETVTKRTSIFHYLASKSGSLPVKRPRCYTSASKTTAHTHTSSLSTTMLRTAKLTHYSFEYNAHVIRTFVLCFCGSHATKFL